MLQERLIRYVGDPAAGRFDSLAHEVFNYQFRRIEPFRRLCEAREIDPETLTDWRQIPAVPSLAFRTQRLEAEPAAVVFRSSGTTGSARVVHYQAFPEIYRAVIDASFPQACTPHLDRPPTLSLIPRLKQVPDSSLAFMVDHVLTRFGSPASAVAFGDDGVDLPTARSWLAARQREGVPILLLSTAFAMVQLLEGLERIDLRFRLPAGSVLFETGGYKGRSREVARKDLLQEVEERLGIESGSVVREYGMTELTSQFYTGALTGGDPDLFIPSHWTRVQILHPETLDEVEPGEKGLISILDLANQGSVMRILTEDLGVEKEEGFRLAGRADDAQLRGCSLTVEELMASSQLF